MKVVLIHGIHSKEGANNMSALLPHLQKHCLLPIRLHEYGFMGFWRARFSNAGEAERLARVVEPGDVVITHSNGAAITYLACRDHGMRPEGVVNINPALDRWRCAEEATWVETIHSPEDRWVWLSQWLPGHLWGDQGKVGYKGKSSHVINHDAGGFDAPMRYEGHCDLFSSKRIDKWANFIAQRIAERTGRWWW